jgi:hypothetical protein
MWRNEKRPSPDRRITDGFQRRSGIECIGPDDPSPSSEVPSRVVDRDCAGGAGPRPWKWTSEQYHQLGDLGFFQGQRVELIRGEIVLRSPRNEPHVTSVSLTTDTLRAAFGPGFFVRVQAPLSFGLESVPEPDVAVVPGSPRDYSDHRPPRYWSSR